MLWKMIIIGTFSFGANQSVNFNELTLRQELKFNGVLNMSTRGFDSKEHCEIQAAAVPNSFAYGTMTVTVQEKKCVEDTGPTT